MRPAGRAWMLLCVSAALVLAGCAALNTPAKENQERRQRARETAKELDQRRDAADMLAARERLQSGELPQACEILERVLVRNPDQAEAQELLAEISAKTAGEGPSGKEADNRQPASLFSDQDTGIALAADQSGFPTRQASWVETRSVAGGAGNADRAASSGVSGQAGSGPADRVRALLLPADEALRRGDADAALAEMRRAGENNPHDPQIPLSAAALLLRHNQTAGAMHLLAESAGRFPNCPAIHRMLGTAQYRLGDYQNAQLAFQQALSLDKSSALSYFLLGCTLAKLGQKGAAEAHFQQAAMLDPRYGVQH